MHEIPGGAVGCALAVAGDAVAGTPEPAQLLDVQVQQVTGCPVLVALRHWPGLEPGQAIEASAPEQATDRAGRQLQLGGDLPVAPRRLPVLDELPDDRTRRRMRAAVRS
jgi:hypothetical protein